MILSGANQVLGRGTRMPLPNSRHASNHWRINSTLVARVASSASPPPSKSIFTEQLVHNGNSSNGVNSQHFVDPDMRPPADASLEPAGPSGRHATDASMAEVLSREVGLSSVQTAWMLTNWPALLEVEPSVVRTAIHTICTATGCKKAQAGAMLLKQHELLHAKQGTLEQRAAALAGVLGVTPAAVLEAAQHMPSILYEPPAVVKKRLQVAAGVLDAPLCRVAPAALQEVWLLRTSAKALRERLEGLGKRLGMEVPAVKVLVLNHPQLLAMSQECLEGKLVGLMQALHLKPESARALVSRYPDVLTPSPATMHAHVEALASVLSHKRLQAMVFEEASILTRAPATVLRNLASLKSTLACSQELVLELAGRRPALLTRSPSSVSASFRALSIWKFSAVEKRELVSAHPLLLRLSAREVHGRCRWLRTLMMSNGYYHSALRETPMSLLGIVILHLPVAWGRLQYLAESSQEASLELMRVVQDNAPAFARAYPEYEKWLAWKRTTVGGLTPWRVVKSKRAALAKRGGRAVRAGSRSTPGKHAPMPSEASSAAAPLPTATIVHEARTVVMGGHFVRKPRRVERVEKVKTPTPARESGSVAASAAATQ